MERRHDRESRDALSDDSAAYQPLVLLVAAVASGVLIDRRSDLSPTFWTIAGLTTLAAWSGFFLRRATRTASATLLAAAVAWGGAWHHAAWNLFSDDDLGFYATETSRPATVRAFAVGVPRWSPAPPASALCSLPSTDHTDLAVRLESVWRHGAWQSASGQASLRVRGKLDGVFDGDLLRVQAKVQAPGEPLNPGERSLADFERGRRRLCRLSCDSIEQVRKVAEGSRWTWRRAVGGVRQAGERILQRHLDERTAPLANAMLLGAREQLPQSTTDDFFRTGVVHLISISGLHVGILAYGFWWLARLFAAPRRATLAAAAVLVVAYALLTDANPPVVRAAVLIVSLCAARWWGRRAFSFNTLAAAGLVVLALNPNSLFQVGAQLSFLAVATLACWNPLTQGGASHDPLDQLLERTRPWWARASRKFGVWLWNGFLTSAAIWLVATPLVWRQFQLLSPIGLALNPIVMGPTVVAMYGGFGALALGSLAPRLADPCGAICGLGLRFLETCVAWALRVPGGHLFCPAPADAWVAMFYATLAILVAFPALRPAPRRWPWLCGATMAVGWLTTGSEHLPQWRRDPERLDCTFIAVGHGASVLLESSDGKKVLYDAGRVGPPEVGARAISAVLWSRGITRLDAIVVSHADTDHYNAIPELLRRFSVDAIYVSPVMFRERSAALDELRRGIARAATPIRTLRAGDQWPFGPHGRLRVLHPPEKGVPGSDNANSIVLLAEQGARKILLTGDLEGAGLAALLAEPPIACDVLMAPHHGSAHSEPVAVARWTTPAVTVISGGRGRNSRAVRTAYGAAGSRVLHTAEDGAVRISLTPWTVDLRPWRRPRP